MNFTTTLTAAHFSLIQLLEYFARCLTAKIICCLAASERLDCYLIGIAAHRRWWQEHGVRRLYAICGNSFSFIFYLVLFFRISVLHGVYICSQAQQYARNDETETSK